jgi:hypothetical protein
MSKMYDDKAVTAGMIGFIVLIVMFNLVEAIYPLRPYVGKSVSTAICFIIGFVPAYVYFHRKKRGRSNRSQ